MRKTNIFAFLVLAASLVACAGQQTVEPKLAERGDPSYFKVRDSMSDEVYVNQDVAKADWVDRVRRIYIAPAQVDGVQIIQPDGVRASDMDAWKMGESEQRSLQKTYLAEMAKALSGNASFHTAASAEDAQAVLKARVIAIHPYVPRSVVEAGGKGGGAVTMLFTVVDPRDDTVMIRLLDSKSTDDIYAFRNVEEDHRALNLIFESWGHQIRRSLLFLQGRLNYVLPPIQLKSQ